MSGKTVIRITALFDPSTPMEVMAYIAKHSLHMEQNVIEHADGRSKAAKSKKTPSKRVTVEDVLKVMQAHKISWNPSKLSDKLGITYGAAYQQLTKLVAAKKVIKTDDTYKVAA